MMRMPWSVKNLPNQPSTPYTRISARPTITGETTNGRSISASRIALPLPLPRTSTSAQPTPKIVLSGTAIAATSTVSQKALIAAGVVIQPHATPAPCSNVRPNTTARGSSRSSVRYSSATARRESVVRRLMGNATPQAPGEHQDHQRNREQDHGQRGRRLRGVVLDVGEDHDAGDLDLADDQQQRADLPDR